MDTLEAKVGAASELIDRLEALREAAADGASQLESKVRLCGAAPTQMGVAMRTLILAAVCSASRATLTHDRSRSLLVSPVVPASRRIVV